MSVSTSNPSLNGHLHFCLHYPADIDRIQNEGAPDKILQYRVDYNNRPSHAISVMTVIVSTTGLLQCEFVCLLFLQTAHRETDRVQRLRITVGGEGTAATSKVTFFVDKEIVSPFVTSESESVSISSGCFLVVLYPPRSAYIRKKC